MSVHLVCFFSSWRKLLVVDVSSWTLCFSTWHWAKCNVPVGLFNLGGSAILASLEVCPLSPVRQRTASIIVVFVCVLCFRPAPKQLKQKTTLSWMFSRSPRLICFGSGPRVWNFQTGPVGSHLPMGPSEIVHIKVCFSKVLWSSGCAYVAFCFCIFW